MIRLKSRLAMRGALAASAASVLAVGMAACGASSPAAPRTNSSSTDVPALPGTGKPAVTIGDKNFTEQFILGQLYTQALQAQGFTVNLNPNIGPTEVTLQALQSGQLDMYPEYLGNWNTTVAGYHQTFQTRADAYQAAQRYALAHGLQLLSPTPFSDTDAIGVTFTYGTENQLRTIADLRKVAQSLTLGAPPQFEQNPADLPALEEAYGFMPQAFKALAVGEQYTALDQGTVQAADVQTTDGELVTGSYELLGDPRNVFRFGNAIPVVTPKVLSAEGPAFVQIIDKVSALLTTPVMRQLNAAVDVYHQDPQTAAKEFLQAHGLVPLTGG